MSRACVDSSCLVALALAEPGSRALAKRLETFGELLASGLLEAELRVALAREGVESDLSWLGRITWILPDRPLSPEIKQVLAAGYVRGADCWHLANALYASPEPGDLAFLTLDERQGKVAKALGFRA